MKLDACIALPVYPVLAQRVEKVQKQLIKKKNSTSPEIQFKEL